MNGIKQVIINNIDFTEKLRAVGWRKNFAYDFYWFQVLVSPEQNEYLKKHLKNENTVIIVFDCFEEYKNIGIKEKMKFKGSVFKADSETDSAKKRKEYNNEMLFYYSFFLNQEET